MFYKGRDGYWSRRAEGAKECHKECRKCLVDAVVDGASTAECRVTKGVLEVSGCWMGMA